MIVESIVATVGEADRLVITQVVEQMTAKPAMLRSLYRAFLDRPDAAAIGAPPLVGRLVAALRERGIEITEPTCARCGRTNHKLISSTAGGVCKNCRRRQLATTCVSCGKIRVVYGRDPSGGALCSLCSPRPKRLCSLCGRTRVIALRARGDSGDVCESCFKGPAALCQVCGRERRCNFVSAGRPICASCSPRRMSICAHCGKLSPPAVRWPEGPVCEPCYRGALSRRGICETCGAERRLVDPPGPVARLCADCSGAPGLLRCRACNAEERPYKDGLCVRCALVEQARLLIGDTGGPLAPVYRAIISNPQPYSACNWIKQSTSAKILAEISNGTILLSHDALDSYPKRAAANLVRHILVANGVLTPRDDRLVELETWIKDKLEKVSLPNDRQLLRSYATWRVLRRNRERAVLWNRPTTPTAHSKCCFLAAVVFLSFLDTQGLSLRECTQATIDQWFTTGTPYAYYIRDFLNWAMKQKLVRALDVPGFPQRHGATMDENTHWAIVHQLLHDDAIEIGDRVAGCLVLVYGQQVSRIAALTWGQVTIADQQVRLQIGTACISVPEPLAGLFVCLSDHPRPYNGVATPRNTDWLFPGITGGRPVNASVLGARLRRIGIKTTSGRRAALIHLAGHLPAAVLADLLGIHATTAVDWVREAGGDWSNYAAQIAREVMTNYAE